MRLDGLDEVHALDDLAEHDVLVVEPRGHDGRDEELSSGSLCVAFNRDCGAESEGVIEGSKHEIK